MFLDAERFHCGRSDETASHHLQVMGAVLAQPDTTSVIDPETDARPPSEPVGSAGNLLDLDSTLDTGKPPQLLDHKIGL